MYLWSQGCSKLQATIQAGIKNQKAGSKTWAIQILYSQGVVGLAQ